MNISIIGAGAWGTAIAIVLGRKGSHRVRLWVYEKEVVDSITNKRTNDLFLPGSPTQGIIDWIRANIRPRAAAA